MFSLEMIKKQAKLSSFIQIMDKNGAKTVIN